MSSWSSRDTLYGEDEHWPLRLEGERGERLAVALLTELLRDQEYLGRFLKRLANHPETRIGIQENLKIETIERERAFKNDAHEQRFVDLVLTSDQLTICVEAKVYANLADHQVNDYLNEARRDGKKGCLFVLCREPEKLKNLSGEGWVAALGWKDLLSDLEPRLQSDHSVWIAQGFKAFMDKFLGTAVRQHLESWCNGSVDEPRPEQKAALDSYVMDGPAVRNSGQSRSMRVPGYMGWYVNSPDGSAQRAFIGFVEAKGYWAYLGGEPDKAHGWQLVVALPIAWAHAVDVGVNLSTVDRKEGVGTKGVVDLTWSAADEVVYKPKPNELEGLIRRMATHSAPSP